MSSMFMPAKPSRNHGIFESRKSAVHAWAGALAVSTGIWVMLILAALVLVQATR